LIILSKFKPYTYYMLSKKYKGLYLVPVFILPAFAFVIALSGYINNTSKPVTTEKCFILSDIHFDPLWGAHRDTALYQKLVNLPVEQWKALFETQKKQTTVNSDLLGKDANYGVLKSALANMKSKLADPAFIVIAGDFIWHGAKPKDSILKRKVMFFIAGLFKENFPNTTIIPALGNNDTYGNDYELQEPKYLKDFADAWSPNLPKSAADEIKANNFYSIRKGNIKFLVVNSASLAYGSQYQEQADTQLAWLQANLSNADNKNIWIISHIPPGLNGYNNKNMWNVDNTQTFVNSLVKYADKVKFEIASHTHFNDFKIYYDAAKKPVAFMRIVPSICSNHGNNPSFEIADFNSNEGSIINETNYYLHLDAIPKDQDGAGAPWENTISLYASFNISNYKPQSISKIIDNIRTDKSGLEVHNYVKFYTVDTPTDSSKTINRANYLNYLKADSLKAN